MLKKLLCLLLCLAMLSGLSACGGIGDGEGTTTEAVLLQEHYNWSDGVKIIGEEESNEVAELGPFYTPFLALYYQDDRLVGEVLYKERLRRSISFFRIGELDPETGELASIGESEYIKQVKELTKDVEDLSTVKGIGFDGEKFVLVYNE